MQTQETGVLDRIHELQKALADLDQEIGNDATSIQGKHTRRTALHAKISLLVQIQRQVSDSSGLLTKEYEGAQKLSTEVGAFVDKELPHIRGQLSDVTVARIDTGLEAIDGEIVLSEADLGRTQDAAAAAQQQLADTQATMARVSSQRVATLNQLRLLPKVIQEAASEVKRLRKELEAVISAGNLARAYYLAIELRAALELLRAVKSDQQEKQLRTALDNQLEAFLKAQAEEQQQAISVRQTKEAMEAAREKLGALKKQRQKRIAELLDSTPGVSAAGAPGRPSAARARLS